MVRFLALLAASTALALIAILLLPMTGLARASGEIAWTASLYADKTRIAETIRGPRVLVVGGSSTLFSFDAELVQKRLGRPVINFGTHAGLGIDYILDRATRVMRAGDTVILVPEYELLAQTASASEYAIQTVAFYDRSYTNGLFLRDRPQYLFGYGVLPSLLSGARALLGHGAAGRDDIVLDKAGDARGNTVARSNTEGFRDATPGALTVAPERAAHLRAFADAAHARGVTVLVIPPALIATPGYRSASFREFQEGLAPRFAAMGMQPAWNPEAAFLPPDDMYDSVYHANDRGRALYTAHMLDALCRAMPCR